MGTGPDHTSGPHVSRLQAGPGEESVRCSASGSSSQVSGQLEVQAPSEVGPPPSRLSLPSQGGGLGAGQRPHLQGQGEGKVEPKAASSEPSPVPPGHTLLVTLRVRCSGKVGAPGVSPPRLAPGWLGLAPEPSAVCARERPGLGVLPHGCHSLSGPTLFCFSFFLFFN